MRVDHRTRERTAEGPGRRSEGEEGRARHSPRTCSGPTRAARHRRGDRPPSRCVRGPVGRGPFGFAGEGRGSMARLGWKRGAPPGETTATPGIPGGSERCGRWSRRGHRRRPPSFGGGHALHPAPPVRRAPSGCTRETVGDNHRIRGTLPERPAVPPRGHAPVTCVCAPRTDTARSSTPFHGPGDRFRPAPGSFRRTDTTSSDICGVSQLRVPGSVASFSAQSLVRVTYVNLVARRP